MNSASNKSPRTPASRPGPCLSDTCRKEACGPNRPVPFTARLRARFTRTISLPAVSPRESAATDVGRPGPEPNADERSLFRKATKARRSLLDGLLAFALFLAALPASAGAAQFAERIQFTQPDGTVLFLNGEGNEYRAVYENSDGYTVVFVPEALAYHYATLSADGNELVSSGLQVGRGDPGAMGLQKHLRIRPAAAREEARLNRVDFENRLSISKRWTELKASRSSPHSPQLAMLRYGPTLGTKCGVTFLIDFDDTPGTVAPAEIGKFLNGDNYRGNGNKGSVKEYFTDVSNGKLLYTNLVIGYIRIPRSLHPRSYYNDLNRYPSLSVSYLIRDAIDVLTHQPNFQAEILPRLEAVSVDEAGEILASNFLVAGADSGVWAKGLWPAMDLLLTTIGPQELWPGGKRVNMYQMTTMTFLGAPLQIGAFCHETGHLLCGFPDLYDYDAQSAGGSGNFCLMGYLGDRSNPPHVCAYLKYMAGWATVTELLPGAPRTFTLSASALDPAHFLRYRPAGFNRLPGHEYYLVENRQRTGRDAQIPGSGILVWHIDELGNSNDENLLPNGTHANYEVTLVQADNRWDLERDPTNVGDGTDPFYAGNRARGYENRFSDSTSPAASWWDGTRSGLELRDFSTNGLLMTVTAEIRPPILLRDPLSQVVNLGDDLLLTVQMATNGPYAYAWTKAGQPLANDDRVAGVDGPSLALRGVVLKDGGDYRVIVSGPGGYQETSRVAQVTVTDVRRLVSTDLGDARSNPGNTVVLTNGVRVTAAGSGLEGVVESCRFLAESVTGDCDVRVRVADIHPEDGQLLLFERPISGQAGLMIRAGLDPDGPSAALVLQPDLFLGTGIRALARGGRTRPATEFARSHVAQGLDNWVRLKREGDAVSLYYSSDGKAWDTLGTVHLPLGAVAWVGPFATSGQPLQRVIANLHAYTLQTNAAPTFAIAAVRNAAREGSTAPARLAVTASRNGPLHATYTLRDPSANGTAYESLDGQLDFPAGTNVTYVDVLPTRNTLAGPPTVVTLSVSASGVTQSSASVILFDDDEPGHGLMREAFSPIPGTAVTDLTGHYRYPGNATLGTTPSFESSTTENAGEVLSGYLTPPATGPYRFYLAAAHSGELWLSPDTSAERAVKIAEERDKNTRRNWPGYGATNHISAPVMLEQGRWYYVKALHKTGLGTSLLAVAWQPPGAEPPAAGSAPIAGDYLTWSLPPASGASTAPLRLAVTPEGRLSLSFDDHSGTAWTLEASSDLVGWKPVLTTNRLDRIDVTALGAGASTAVSRFYRLKAAGL